MRERNKLAYQLKAGELLDDCRRSDVYIDGRIAELVLDVVSRPNADFQPGKGLVVSRLTNGPRAIIPRTPKLSTDRIVELVGTVSTQQGLSEAQHDASGLREIETCRRADRIIAAIVESFRKRIDASLAQLPGPENDAQRIQHAASMLEQCDVEVQLGNDRLGLMPYDAISFGATGPQAEYIRRRVSFQRAITEQARLRVAGMYTVAHPTMLSIRRDGNSENIVALFQTIKPAEVAADDVHAKWGL